MNAEMDISKNQWRSTRGMYGSCITVLKCTEKEEKSISLKLPMLCPTQLLFKPRF